jgi:hypothetical protein
MRVLGIDVAPSLVDRWRRWLGPATQPFFVDRSLARLVPGDVAGELTPELRDTFRVWRIAGDRRHVWLDEASFAALPRSTRTALVRAQVVAGRGAVPTVRAWADVLPAASLRAHADGHRFLWWPSVLDSRSASRVLARVVSEDALPSRHRAVTASTWRIAADVLPGVRALGGTFPNGSGANCFGAVMTAAGVGGVAEEWVQPDAFDDWLTTATRPRGDDDRPGAVLVWRKTDGSATHAAVTLGDGWALEKPSQAWFTPRAIVRVTDVVRTSRMRGEHLSRRQIRSA